MDKSVWQTEKSFLKIKINSAGADQFDQDLQCSLWNFSLSVQIKYDIFHKTFFYKSQKYDRQCPQCCKKRAQVKHAIWSCSGVFYEERGKTDEMTTELVNL